jgi:predicted transcriptional regulator
VRKLQPNECNWQPPKGINIDIEKSDDIKAVLQALSKMVDGKEKEEVQAMIRESESLIGDIAEFKAQLIEVQSSNFVPQRVEDETSALRQEQLEWNAKNMALRKEIDRVKAEIEKSDAGKL